MNRRDFIKGVSIAAIAFSGCKKGGIKAEGFGRHTIGGRGGRTIWVSSAEDLEYALLLKEPRIIKFAKDGLHDLPSLIDVHYGNVTLDGSDNAVCLKGAYIRFFCDDVIVKNMRFRSGAEHPIPSDGLNFWGSRNVVVDHCSFSWAVDELFQVSGGSNITIQWCIFSEALNHPDHPRANRSLGPWMEFGVDGLSMHHNLVAHCGERLPDFYGGKLDLRNHIVYNHGPQSMNLVPIYAPVHANVVNTEWINGEASDYAWSINPGKDGEYTYSDESGIYIQGNICPGRPTDDLPENYACYELYRKMNIIRDGDPYKYPNVKTHTVEEGRELILSRVGAQPRDSVDERIVNDVRNGTGRIIDDPSEVGGWPEL